MDPETIKALADVPVVGVLIFLLVRQQLQNEKLLLQFAESEREHAKNLVTILTSGTFCKHAVPLEEYKN